MRFCVLTLYTPEIADFGAASSENKRAYAARHGYGFVGRSASLDQARPPSWGKIKLCLEVMPDFDWLFWSDADSVIMNLAIELPSIADRRADFIYACDCNGMNAGVFLLRCCPESRRLLELAYQQTQFIDHPWWEQLALVQIINSGESGVITKVVPRRVLNAYHNPGCADFRDGDFIVHFVDHPSAKRARVLDACAGKLETVYRPV